MIWVQRLLGAQRMVADVGTVISAVLVTGISRYIVVEWRFRLGRSAFSGLWKAVMRWLRATAWWITSSGKMRVATGERYICRKIARRQ